MTVSPLLEDLEPPLFDDVPPPFVPVDEEEISAVAASLVSDPLTSPFSKYSVANFEDSFSALFGATHAVAVSSGTKALVYALWAAGIGQGDEVVVTPYSFVASASVVLEVGATPVFADIEPDGFTMDPVAFEAAISTRTRAVIPVHQCGFPCDMTAIRSVAAAHRITVIEDAAAAHGARVDDAYVGTLGDYGCFSFNIGKILRTGEGGMVCCHSEEARDRLRLIRVNGMGPHPEGGMEIWRFGSNATLANPLAAIGVIQLSRFQKIAERRTEIFTRFLDGIAGLPIKLACGRSGLEPAYYSCAMRLDQEWVTHRKALLESLAYDRAPIGAGNKKLLHHLPFLAEKARPTECPVAEALHPTMLYFDPVQTLSDHAVDATVESLRRAFNRVKL